eukprot:TRINITY_DN21114_c0_g1_i1.p1 TRINITY_DN21114_c0_g1~~TRINITY_DN21114_c0_g1_i1.p1  ORF type:complete len:347 (-),score=44.03 TRINITY_DN21114_c0_g1_i1:66-1106(-)
MHRSMSPRSPRRRCWCCPWRPVARGFEAVAATVYGDLGDDDEDTDLEEEPARYRSPTHDKSSLSTERLADNDDFVEFFDAIDEISEPDNQLEHSLGSSAVLPKLKTDDEIASNYSVPIRAIQELKVEFPECPAAELARFLARKSVSGSPQKAAKPIDLYLKWRSEIPCWPPDPPGLPAPFRFNGFAKDGSRILLMLPCVIDPDFKPEAYCHSFARTLDAELERADTMRCTVLADCRGHQSLGYVGKPVWKIWSHISAVAKVLQTNFPERVQRVVVYPAGDVEMGAFRMFKSLFSQQTLKRVKLIHDKLGCHAPIPPAELSEFIDVKEIYVDNRQFFEGLENNGDPV